MLSCIVLPVVQLWTVGNYHWYLKQSLEFPAREPDRVAAMEWDPDHAYRLHVISQGGRYLQYTWAWTMHHRATDSSDDACVAVIDGGEYRTSLGIVEQICQQFVCLTTTEDVKSHEGVSLKPM